MFSPFARFFHRSPDSAHEQPFVRDVRVRHPQEPRSRRSEWFLIIGWILILAKCGWIWWACHAYPDAVKINPWSLIAPSLLFGSLCTVLYLRRF